MDELAVYLLKWELLFLVIIGLIAIKEGHHGLQNSNVTQKHPRLGR